MSSGSYPLRNDSGYCIVENNLPADSKRRRRLSTSSANSTLKTNNGERFKWFVVIFVSMGALGLAGLSLLIVIKNTSEKANANARMHAEDDAAVGRNNAGQMRYSFKAPEDNRRSEDSSVIEKGANRLLQRYQITQLLSGGDKREILDGLLKTVESDLASNRAATETAKEFAEIIQASPMTKRDVTDLANEFGREKSYMHSTLMFYAESKMDPQDCENQTFGKNYCLQGIEFATEMFLQDGGSDGIVRSFILPLMKDVLNDARRMTCSSRDKEVTQTAWCLRTIGLAYYSIGDDASFAMKSEEAVQFLEAELGLNATTYRVYGLCLDSVAAAYNRMEDYELSLAYYQQTLEAYRAATDWSSPLEQKIYVDQTETNIRATKRKTSEKT